MSDAPHTNASSEPLQFDRAVHSGGAGEPPPAPSIDCSKCKAQVRSYYYHVDGESVCAKCKQEAEHAGGATRTGGAWIRAAFYGLVASLVGATLYYGVIALFNLEIGIVAILIGFMVGAAVRTGAKGGGGRRYQVLAAALTYLSVGMAYAPVAYKGFVQARMEKVTARSDSSRRAAAAFPDSADDAVADEGAAAGAAADSVAAEETVAASRLPRDSVKQLGVGVILLGLGATLLVIFVLPIMVVLGTLPSGIISALIIGFGIRQAWRMTEGTVLMITGPYKVGATAAPAAAA